MKKIIVFAGVMGMLFISGANAAGAILATENTVTTESNTASGYVTAVESAAATDAATNTANAGTISDMQSDRQGLAANNPCATDYDTNKYSGCGYISADGTDGAKQWVKIRKAI